MAFGKTLVLSLSLCLASLPLLAYQTDLATLLEDRLPWATEETASEAQLDAWIQAMAHPLDINVATYEQLDQLQVLSPEQIEALLLHREQYGQLVSLYELQAVPGWDITLLRKVAPFLWVASTETDGQPLTQRILREENRYLLWRYETQQPVNNEYPGSNGRWLGRLRISHTRDFSLGITIEKDAGEQFLFQPKQRQYGPDFVSGHLLAQGKGLVQRWVVGDFQVHWGQGLATAAGFAPGKGGETIMSVRRPSRGLVPYTSAMEAGFYRGAGITMGTERLQVTALASHQMRDATLQADTSGNIWASALRTDGYHRSASELAGRKALRESTAGLAVQYQSRFHRQELGAYVLAHHWSNPWQPRLRPDNVEIFRGQLLPLAGIFGQWRHQNLLTFGELAVSEGKHMAGILGLQAHLSPAWQMAWLLRNYAPGFTTLYGEAFGEASQPRNEQGVYWGVNFQPSKRWRFAAYYDRFTFPWLRFQTAAPSAGYETLIRGSWHPQRHLEFALQMRREVKDRTLSESGSTLAQVLPGTKDNALFQINFRPPQGLGTRIRVQGSQFQFQDNRTYGLALIHDLFWEQGVWKFSGRIAAFHAPDFENRQYVYENHVLYAFALPAYYGRGIRTYLNARIKPMRGLTLDGRWARTFLHPESAVAPYPLPNHQITLQAKWQF